MEILTGGFTNLEKTATAPVRTNEISPKVKAFQVFKAIRPKAKGTRTAVLNFNPNKNGKITFFTILEERPEIIIFNIGQSVNRR